MLCGGVRVASGDWDLVDDTIVVLRWVAGGLGCTWWVMES